LIEAIRNNQERLRKAITLMGLMLSGIFLVESLTEIALVQYFRVNRAHYRKAILHVDEFSFPLTSGGRPLGKYLMASGVVGGEHVRVPLKSLKNTIVSLPKDSRARALRELDKEVPGYVSLDPEIATRLLKGRSRKFVEADYFENGHRTANAVFAVSLVASCFLGWQARLLVKRDRAEELTKSK